MVLGFGLALLLNREIRGRNILRTIMILPLFATPVALGYLGITIFYETNGPVNVLIRSLGGARTYPGFPTPSGRVLQSLLWIYGSGPPLSFWFRWQRCKGCPRICMKRRQWDGAGGWQLFRRITLPLMMPTLWFILLLRMVDAFKVFDIPMSLTLGGPGRATEVYSMYMYRTGMRFFDHGYAAAQGFLLLFLVSVIVSLLFGRIRSLYEEA